jgi:hypothetical protein
MFMTNASASQKNKQYIPSDTTVQFMLSEINRVSENWRHADDIAEHRLTAYLTIVSGATGVLLVLSQLQISFSDFMRISLLIFLAIWLFGIIIFLRLINRNQVVVEYIRAINRLRRFFVDLDPFIKKYQWLPVTDTHPKFTSFAARKIGSRTLVATISSGGIGLATTAAYTLFSGSSILMNVGILIGVGAFLTQLVVMEGYATRKFKRLEEQYDVRFPK